MRKLAGLLTTVSHASTPFISIFLIIHLAAPVLANVGGTDAASQTMILGREYYQTDFGETYLVLGPIVLHTLAGISKRLLLASSNFAKRDDDKNDTASAAAVAADAATATPNHRQTFLPRSLLSVLSITGHTTALLFLPIHFLLHRQYPLTTTTTATATTINHPLSLDFEYVKFGLQTWPKRSWFLYAGLVGFATLHAVEGITIIWNTWSTRPPFSRRTRRALVLGTVFVPVLAGLAAIAREPPMMLSFVKNWYRAAYMESFIFH